MDVGGRFDALVRGGSIFLLQVGDPERAQAPLEAAHELRPSDIFCLSLLADCLIAREHHAKAKDLLSACAGGSPKPRRSKELVPIYERLANLASTGESSDRLSWLTLAFEVDPQNPSLAHHFAQAALQDGRDDLAEKALRAIIMVRQASPAMKADAFVQLALLARKSGDPRKAQQLTKRALDEQPQHEGARTLLRALESPSNSS
jgi:tetratricopeptide (TPR) repeat protein